MPLPPDVVCYAAAATKGTREGDVKDAVLGDGLVPIESALGKHSDAQKALPIPPERTHVAYGMNHFDLLHQPVVHALVARWMDEAVDFQP